MTNNYYALKRDAAKQLAQYIQYVHNNKTEAVSLSQITIAFQEKYGFSEKTVLKMLEPYFKAKSIAMHDEQIMAAA